jgi:hypothetical protein
MMAIAARVSGLLNEDSWWSALCTRDAVAQAPVACFVWCHATGAVTDLFS